MPGCLTTLVGAIVGGVIGGVWGALTAAPPDPNAMVDLQGELAPFTDALLGIFIGIAIVLIGSALWTRLQRFANRNVNPSQ